MFGFLCLNGESIAHSTQKCKQENLREFFQKVRNKNPVGWLVVILDNAKIHKSRQVQKFCQINQIFLLYLPSYSPDLNPIEYVRMRCQTNFSQILFTTFPVVCEVQ